MAELAIMLWYGRIVPKPQNCTPRLTERFLNVVQDTKDKFKQLKATMWKSKGKQNNPKSHYSSKLKTSYTFRKCILLNLILQIATLWDVGELHCGGIHGVARRSKWAMITTAVCLRSIASSLSCGKVRYLRKLSFGLRG